MGPGHRYQARPRPPIVHVPARLRRRPWTSLIATLEDLKRQREALEKQEKAVVEQLKGRLKDQQERLTKLGLIPPKPAEADKIDVPGIEVTPPPIPAAPR